MISSRRTENKNMKPKPYKAKSLKSAERMVRNLRRQIKERDDLLKEFSTNLKTLAKLSAETPQFFNPLDVMQAKRLRDFILSQST